MEAGLLMDESTDTRWQRCISYADGRPQRRFWAPDSYEVPAEDAWTEIVEEKTEQQLAEEMYPNHHPTIAFLNYKARKEVWDSNGDVW